MNNESTFEGGALGFLGWNLLTGLLFIPGILTFGLLLAWVIVARKRWIVNNTYIDGQRLRFDGTALSFWGHIFLWSILTTITFGLYSFLGFMSKSMVKWYAVRTHRDI